MKKSLSGLISIGAGGIDPSWTMSFRPGTGQLHQVRARRRGKRLRLITAAKEIRAISRGRVLRSLPFFFVFILLIAGGCEKGVGSGSPPVPTVEVTEAIIRDVPVYSEWVTSLDGSVNATIRAQVQGYLIQQLYREGDFVKKGQVLFQIDPRPFKAALDQAEADWEQAKANWNKSCAVLEQARAELARMEAEHAIAETNLRRIRDLSQQQLVSQKDLDDAIAAEQSARASVGAARATVTAAQATVAVSQAAVSSARAARERARLNLSFTTITSPLNGIAGLAKAQVGNLVGPGSLEELTVVSTVDPIRVYIPLTEIEYLRHLQQPTGRGRAFQVPLELFLADGTVHPHAGTFAFTDRQVDEKTGTIKVAALFPNPGNILRPGQFARVRAQIALKKAALLIPQRAVMELQGMHQVAVVSPDNRVSIRRVRLGQRLEGLCSVEEGLAVGERVIVEGIQKVRDGMIVNSIPYSPRSSPRG